MRQLSTKREGLQVYCADVLALLASLPQASVNLIATDPPYFRVKDEPWDRQWDKAEGFLSWLGQVCDELRRVLKPNGSLYLFASPQMASRVEAVVGERFNVLNHIVWRKHDGTGYDTGGHSKIAEEALRCFFPQTERVIFAEPPVSAIVGYLRAEAEAAGLTPEQVSGVLGFAETPGSIAPRRYLREDGFAPMRAEHYERLRHITGRFGRPYEEVYRPFLAPSGAYTDVWDFPTVQGYPGKHPCEKPLSLASHIVTVSSREGDTLLDPFCGSGVFGEAALRLGRKAILGDASDHWSQYAAAKLDRQFGALPAGCGRVKKPKQSQQPSLLEVMA
jgi:adenine-specific DNA-methyltransferase